ncbi:MAG: class I SAM-dependent methyltransferase [Pseudomonadota bacterium]|nr:MAG: class I SAM-dependent methyltransferase [Pseudomonadota bacterium]
MERIPEPELMDEDAQARAYAQADFEEPHAQFIAWFRERFAGASVTGAVIDLGCGPADISIRFAQAFPECHVHGVDGAAAMLRYGREAVRAADLAERVRLLEGYLPGAALPQVHYDIIISNSLLHHLADPTVLWREIRARAAPGTLTFIMDLMRPGDQRAAQVLVDTYAEGEPEVLRHDFFNSLLAAYQPEEVEAQLAAAGLGWLEVRVASDRHLVVSGVCG